MASNPSPSSGKGHAKPSDNEDDLYTRVELPGVYQESVKLWVRVGSMFVKGTDVLAATAQGEKITINLQKASVEAGQLMLMFCPQVKVSGHTNVVDADLVLGQPQQLEEETDAKFSKVQLPGGVFGTNVKLWVKKEAMYVKFTQINKEAYSAKNLSEASRAIRDFNFVPPDVNVAKYGNFTVVLAPTTTAASAAPPKDSIYSKDFDAAMKNSYKAFQAMNTKFRTEFPDAEVPVFPWDGQSYETLQDNAPEMFANFKGKMMAQEPEFSKQLSDVLYSHPFQVKGNTRPYELKNDKDKWYARVDMPGLESNDVKVRFQNNSVYFMAEEKGKEGDDARGYSTKFNVPPGEYQTNKLSATVKNGVLEIVIPKILKRLGK